MNGRRFRYALEPVLLARGWRVDALQLELAQCNTRLEAQRRELGQAGLRTTAALEEWRGLSAPGRPLDPARAAAYASHVIRLERQADAMRRELARLDAQREEVAGRLARALQEQEALEDHRLEQRKVFDAAQAGAECKAADEQWMTLRNRSGDVHQA
jgi:hypothetical protein